MSSRNNLNRTKFNCRTLAVIDSLEHRALLAATATINSLGDTSGMYRQFTHGPGERVLEKRQVSRIGVQPDSQLEFRIGSRSFSDRATGGDFSVDFQGFDSAGNAIISYLKYGSGPTSGKSSSFPPMAQREENSNLRDRVCELARH